VRGPISDLPRKNCWTLAEYAGDPTPDRMQRLLERASWDTLATMATVRAIAVDHLTGDGLAVLVLDEGGDEKTGTATCGVKRQYVGCAGKVANAVNFVNATYSTPRGHALIGSRLYIPAEQLADGYPTGDGRRPWPGVQDQATVGCRSAHRRPGRRRAGGLVYRGRVLRPRPRATRVLRETAYLGHEEESCSTPWAGRDGRVGDIPWLTGQWYSSRGYAFRRDWSVAALLWTI
jgi:hypothetical protein